MLKSHGLDIFNDIHILIRMTNVSTPNSGTSLSYRMTSPAHENDSLSKRYAFY